MNLSEGRDAQDVAGYHEEDGDAGSARVNGPDDGKLQEEAVLVRDAPAMSDEGEPQISEVEDVNHEGGDATQAVKVCGRPQWLRRLVGRVLQP